MRTLRVADFLTLDGVMEEPNSWSLAFADKEIDQDVGGGMSHTDAVLFGRRNYEEFAAAWQERTGPLADFFNNVHKYVVSTTLSEATWNNSTLIKDHVAQEVARLKAQPGQDILLVGSSDLVNFLQQHDLIDEYWLLVYPLVLGTGKRLFHEGTKATLRLVEAKPYSTGVVSLIYHPVRE